MHLWNHVTEISYLVARMLRFCRIRALARPFLLEKTRLPGSAIIPKAFGYGTRFMEKSFLISLFSTYFRPGISRPPSMSNNGAVRGVKRLS